jgi:cell division protein FtsZ
MQNAKAGIEKLKANVDTLLTIPNERLSIICDEEITAQNAFDMADDVLKLGIQSIAELVTLPGEINLDFADIKTIMENSGPAWMSIGYGSGENRAKEAAHQAISNPLLDISVEEATGVLFNVTGGNDLLLSELNQAAEVIQNVVHRDANIIFGMTTDEKMNTQVKLTVIATGMPVNPQSSLPDSIPDDDTDIPPFMRRINKYRNANSATTLNNQPDVA